MTPTTPNINRILAKNERSCRYGAPMGDKNIYDGSIYLHLQRVDLVDGDYGPDGTYWGASKTGHIYCAFNADNAEHAAGHGTRIYVRASFRDEAKLLIMKDYVNVRFKR